MPAAAIEARAAHARHQRAARLTGLYAITPELEDTDRLVEAVAAALEGGARAIQYRYKNADGAHRLAQAVRLAALCRERGALLIVNDDPALAARVGADGVHVGEDDAALDEARRIAGSDRLVGVSCYDDLARARAMSAAGADYIAFGSLYPSKVKPEARRASLGLVRAARGLGARVVGIGGIDATNAAEAIEAGCDAVAVISAVFASADIRAAAQAIATACEAGRAARPRT